MLSQNKYGACVIVTIVNLLLFYGMLMYVHDNT